MKIIQKLAQKNANIEENAPVTIAFLGDSVTQGCFEIYKTGEQSLETVFDAENAYHTKVRKILNMLFPKAALNIINAGISGDSATGGLARIERDVLRYSPDLCVVCFGLNDSCTKTMDEYTKAMTQIFERLEKEGIEIIHLTPNMMSTEISCHITEPFFVEVGKPITEAQTSGRLGEFLEAAKKISESKNIPVCDCYKKWCTLAENGVDTTDLLSNYLNHPIRNMNWMFAYSLVETMFEK